MTEVAKKEKDNAFDIDAWVAAIGATPGAVPKVTLSTGKQVTIKKATAAQLFLIIDILKHVAKHMNLTNFDDLGKSLGSIQDPINFLTLMGDSVDRLTDLISALCDLGAQTVKEGIDLDDLLLVAWAEWKVNEHFFTTRLLPLIQRLDTGERSIERVA